MAKAKSFGIREKFWSSTIALQARSQDLERGGGGLFWKSETSVSDLDSNFHCCRVRFKRLIRNWDGFFRRNRELKRFFHPNTWYPKKKVFTEIETDFSTEIGNSNGSSARITETPSQLPHQIPSGGGGLFSFFEQKSAPKALKTCDFAYFSGQWGARAPSWLRYCCTKRHIA